MRTESDGENRRVLVVQNGARHDYAVPLALARANLLAGFYTDVCGNQGLGRWAGGLSSAPVVGGRLRRLRGREVPPEVLPLTRSFPLAAIADHLHQKMAGPLSDSPLLGTAMTAAGTRGADMIYSALGWSPSFLKQARAQGVKVVTEFYVRPSHWRIHQEEYLKFPGWESAMPHMEFNQHPILRRGACVLSDWLIVPAPSVKDDLVTNELFPAEKISIVPYGINAVTGTASDPVPGQVLFVGNCTLPKGIHYLAMASQILARRGLSTTFTAAGNVTHLVRQQPACSGIDFLGRVPRRDAAQLYERADVLVFPTLSDSFGMVMLEAMAAGVPVISSPYCADVVRHGMDGLVVEPRDPEALADAIQTITQDRPLRQRMSEAARQRAAQYSWERHAHTLVQTLKTITP